MITNVTKRQFVPPHDTDLGDFTDLPPEFCQYRDRGCELVLSCVECPFSICVKEELPLLEKSLRQARDRDISSLLTSRKRPTNKRLAKLFGVSERSVQRARKRTIIPDLTSGLPGDDKDSIAPRHAARHPESLSHHLLPPSPRLGSSATPAFTRHSPTSLGKEGEKTR